MFSASSNNPIAASFSPFPFLCSLHSCSPFTMRNHIRIFLYNAAAPIVISLHFFFFFFFFFFFVYFSVTFYPATWIASSIGYFLLSRVWIPSKEFTGTILTCLFCPTTGFQSNTFRFLFTFRCAFCMRHITRRSHRLGLTTTTSIK